MKDRIPGVGSSIGLDRLIAGLEQLGITGKQTSFVDAIIFCLDNSLMSYYIKIAAELRKSGISVEVFPDCKKINQQYSYAEKKGIPYGILIKQEDLEKNTLTLKNLKTREQTESLTIAQAVEQICKP